jgi:23S rRNA pseudouridine1911/1915/1917 synthase
VINEPPKPQIRILYEDNHLLVVVKPAGMLSQGDRSGDPDLLNRLKDDLKQRYAKPGNVFLGLVHRLDRPVGGVMIFAKTSKAASRLCEQIRTRKMAKVYLAVTRGIPNPAKGRLENWLLKEDPFNLVSIVAPATPGAKHAILDYEVLGSAGNLALVRINLHTGRPHQIRVQMASTGHPLYGDHRYGPSSKDRHEHDNIALCATELTCLHPTTKKKMTFRCPPPTGKPWDRFSVSTLSEYRQTHIQHQNSE